MNTVQSTDNSNSDSEFAGFTSKQVEAAETKLSKLQDPVPGTSYDPDLLSSSEVESAGDISDDPDRHFASNYSTRLAIRDGIGDEAASDSDSEDDIPL